MTTTTNAPIALYIAPAHRISDRDLAGEGNSFKTGADAMRAAESMNETCPLDGDTWVPCYRGPSTAGGVVAGQEALDAFAVDMDAAVMLFINGFGDPVASAEASRLLGHDLEPLADRGEEPSGTTLRAEIAKCVAEARKQGWTGDVYDLTPADCESIVTNLCRKPTREEWAAEGYKWVGGAHVADEDAGDEEQGGEDEEALPREYVILDGEVHGIDTDEDLETARAWLDENELSSAPVFRGHGPDQVKTTLVLFARLDLARAAL